MKLRELSEDEVKKFDELFKERLKADYQAEAVRRWRIRKEARKEKDKRMCKCGRNKGTKYLHSCPFASDIHGNDTEVCRCCGECTHSCAMDI